MTRRPLLAAAALLGGFLVLRGLLSEPEPPMPWGGPWAASQPAWGAFGGHAVTPQNLAVMRAMAGSRGLVPGAQPQRDNIWSSLVGAGNHDPVSGAGYVSVPGYGPVGYGM